MNLFHRGWQQQYGRRVLIGLIIFFSCFPSILLAADTFLEPNKTIALRSPFQVMVQQIHVAEGERVEKGTLLVELDTRTLLAREKQLLEIASFHGVLDSARAVLSMQEKRLQIVEKLSKSGNARQKELEKVQTDLAVSRAKLLEAKEGRARILLELAIIRSQMDERLLISPISAVVLNINKEVSEMTSPADPEPILSLVQLDPLRAVFHLPLTQAQALTQGDVVELMLGEQVMAASVAFISPVIEAQSGTVRVRFQIANPDGLLLSGSRVRYEPK